MKVHRATKISCKVLLQYYAQGRIQEALLGEGEAGTHLPTPVK